MITRRSFVRQSAWLFPLSRFSPFPSGRQPLVVSTWDDGLTANAAAWTVLAGGGTALDAVEQAGIASENEVSCLRGTQCQSGSRRTRDPGCLYYG